MANKGQIRGKVAPPQREGTLTKDRRRHSGDNFELGGDQRSGYRVTMLDSPLGRAYRRKKLSADEYSALCKYALHWHVAGLGGHLGSVDPNRIAAATVGLIGSEAMLDHKVKYYAAKQYLGDKRAYVADAIACYERTVEQTGQDLGYQSPYRGRAKATALLQEAGDQLGYFWSRQH